MKKRNTGLCFFAFLCINNANATEAIARQDNTKIINYTQEAAIYETNRPAAKDRLYSSKAVEEKIQLIKKLLTNARLAWMFENAFPTHWVPPSTTAAEWQT